MTPDEQMFLSELTAQFAAMAYRLDCAMELLRQMPDWEQKLQTLWGDPTGRHSETVQLALFHKLSVGMIQGVLSDQEFLQLLDEVTRIAQCEKGT